MKTTVVLRDDLYYYVKTQFGKRSLSRVINELLANLFEKKRKQKSLFGADKWLLKTRWSDLRDERDHDY